jgi:hypothetical protein
MTIFDFPVELTQENMQLNTNRLNSIRINGIHNVYSGPLNSGPPSVDLEMAAVKNRAESVNSSDSIVTDL